MRHKKNVVVAILIIGILSSLCGCGKKENKVTINVSYSSYTDAALIIAEKKGFFDECLPTGCEISYSHIASSPDIRDAIISEKVDIGAGSIFNFITAYENGMPITLIDFDGGTPVYMYSNSDSITSIDDISAEDRIAINNKATVIHFAFLAHCKENYSDALLYENNLSTIAASDAISSLQTSDEYAAALFNFPTCIAADNIDKLTKIADFSNVMQEYGIGSCMYTRNDFYDNNPEIIEGFKNAQIKAIDYIKENPDDAAAILAEVYGVEKSDVTAVFEIMLPSIEVKGYDKIAELMYEIGVLDKPATAFSDLRNYDEIPK